MPDKCARCATLEDLLETARNQVEHARVEAEKADDEAMELKAEMLRFRMLGSRQDYALVKKFQARAERAEALLAAIEKARTT